MNKTKVVVLLSGGLDSVTALYEANSQYEVTHALSFHYGSKHNDRELPFAAYHADQLHIQHRVIHLDFVSELFKSDLLMSGGEIPMGHYESETMKKTVVPFRNGIMLSIAAGFAESNEAQGLIIASHAGDHIIYPDCREPFMEAMADAIRLGTYAGLELIRPFISWTKTEIVSRGSQLKIDYEKTWSCYVGGEIHCGECGTCVERREAFSLASVCDPTEYKSMGPLPSRLTAQS